MLVWLFLLRITHTIISQSNADSSWITLYTLSGMVENIFSYKYIYIILFCNFHWSLYTTESIYREADKVFMNFCMSFCLQWNPLVNSVLEYNGLYSVDTQFGSQPGHLLSWLSVFVLSIILSVSQSFLQSYTRISLQIRLWQFPSTSIPIYSLITLPHWSLSYWQHN